MIPTARTLAFPRCRSASIRRALRAPTPRLPPIATRLRCPATQALPSPACCPIMRALRVRTPKLSQVPPHFGCALRAQRGGLLDPPPVATRQRAERARAPARHGWQADTAARPPSPRATSAREYRGRRYLGMLAAGVSDVNDAERFTKGPRW